jgi:putative FmdB family regulatory protein
VPTYEYHCDNCAKNFDVVQSFTDDPLTECPTCGSPVRKVFGSVGIVFKGSGFYKTDSRSSTNGGSRAPSEAAATTSAAEGGTSSEAGGSGAKESSGTSSSDGGSAGDGTSKPAPAPASTPKSAATTGA